MYLILTQPSTAYAHTLSSLIWQVSRPVSVRDPADVSSLYCGWIVHPDDGRVAIHVGTDTVYVHPDGDATALAAPLPISQSEKDALVLAINSGKGGHVDPVSLIPASLTGNLITHEEAEQDGWFG